MARCIRSHCNGTIYRLTPAGRERLCEKHYQTLCHHRENKILRATYFCRYCGVSLADSRNSKYCCVLHRQLASRKLLNNLLTHSYWYRVEDMVARSPFKLNSLLSITDVADIIKLQQYKAKHQRSYLLSMSGGSKPIPLFKLELCHRYPVSKGGMNTATNILIGPSLINRMIGNRIPIQDRGFAGIKAMGEMISFNGSLYDGLIGRFGLQEVNEVLGGIKLNRFYGNEPRPMSFKGMDKDLPLFTLLVEELYRLELDEWRALFMALKCHYERLLPFLLELIAALSFYAILTGDRDRFLARLRRFNDWFLSEHSSALHPFRRGGVESFERILVLMLNTYLFKFFAVDTHDPDAIIEFYNRFFSVPVIAMGNPGEVLCYSWFRGKQYPSTTLWLELRSTYNMEDPLCVAEVM